jgi:TetR/AcrR family transcriptional regulator, transcriptional repressor for nem operon
VARPREFDEAEVLGAARDRFWGAGYAATSLNDLTAATGLGKASLYGAFGDKHALYLRVFDDYIVGAVESVRQALAGDDAGALGRIGTYLRANARSSAGNPRGCMLARGTSELAGRDEEVAARSARAHGELSRLYVDAVRAAQRAGDLDAAADPEPLGVLLLAVDRGTEALGRGGASEATLLALVGAALAGLPR